MATVKGQNLRLFLGNVAIAAAQTCELHMRLNVADSSSKDDTDNWMRNEPVGMEWDCRSTGVVTVDPDRNDPASLEDRIGQVVDVRFSLASGTQNSVQDSILASGKAIINDVQINAQNRQNSTYTVLLTGVDDLLYPLGVLFSSNSLRLVTSDDKVLVAEIAQQS